MVRNPPANSGDRGEAVSIPGSEDPLEQEMAMHSSILAWKFSWTEEPDRLQSMGPQESDTAEKLSTKLNNPLYKYISCFVYPFIL